MVMRNYKAAVFTIACLPSAFGRTYEKRQYNAPMVYGFESIPATTDLSWVPCYDIFTCTKILVPLDYENEAAGTTHIAFIKWSSNSTSGNATQDILINPGGPGGGGDGFFQTYLPRLQEAVGTGYNLVSFVSHSPDFIVRRTNISWDPRGVNNSGPSLSCFEGGTKGTSRFYEDLETAVDVNDTRSYGEVFQRMGAFGDFCTEAHKGANDTAKYANTVATATDMLRYTELLAKSKGEDPQKSQLWYWGFSYGTLLGTTFADLFPDRIGRMIVDGVADGEDYFQGRWLGNLVDADKVVRFFFQSCFDAGKEKCSFWAESPAGIEARYKAVEEDITFNPIPITKYGKPATVTVADLKLLVGSVPYFPIDNFPIFDKVLSKLEQRNASTLAGLTETGLLVDFCTTNPALYLDFEPRPFISCIDANGRYNISTLDDFKNHSRMLFEQSEFLGEVWSAITSVACRKLNIRAPESQVLAEYPSANRTSNPLLFVSTEVDPVTPLRAAQKMQARFGGSRLLIQKGFGHTTLAAPSWCIYNHFRKYFKDGSLPEQGTRCDIDEFPFGNQARSAGRARGLKKRHPLGF